MRRVEVTMYDVHINAPFCKEYKKEINGMEYMYVVWTPNKINWARKWQIVEYNDKNEKLIDLIMNVDVLHYRDGVKLEHNYYSLQYLGDVDVFWEYKHPDISKVWEWYWKGGREIYNNLESC